MGFSSEALQLLVGALILRVRKIILYSTAAVLFQA